MHRLAVVAIALIACSKAPARDPVAAQVPGDTAFVATVSLDRLRLSKLWPKIESAVGAKLPLAGLRQSCAADPVRAIESIAIAMPASAAPDRALVFVRGVTRAVADGCASAFAAGQGEPITISEVGSHVEYRGGDDALFARWLDTRTVAFAPGALGSKESLAAFDKPVQRDPAFADALAKLRRDRVLSLAFRSPAQSGLRGFIAQAGYEPESGHGWIDLDTKLSAEIVLRFATAEAASAAAKQQLGGPLAKVQTLARGTDVVFTLALDEAETAQLLEQALPSAP